MLNLKCLAETFNREREEEVAGAGRDLKTRGKVVFVLLKMVIL